MKLITLIAVLLLERFWRKLSHWRADRAAEQWAQRARQRLAGVLGHSVATGIFWLGVPLVLFGLLALVPGGVIGALIYMAVSIGVLILLLAPRQAHHHIEALQRACAAENSAAVDDALAMLGAGTPLAPHSATPECTHESADAPKMAQADTLHTMAERIITLGFYEWFAVLFWFVLAGPAGAVLYRLTDWFAQPSPVREVPDAGCPRLRQLQALMDWPAVRVYAALLLLAGGFNRGLSAWIDGASGAPAKIAQKNSALIQRVGRAALELEREDDCDSAERCLADQSQWIKAAAAIVLRALLFGLGLVAFLTLSSWIH